MTSQSKTFAEEYRSHGFSNYALWIGVRNWILELRGIKQEFSLILIVPFRVNQ